MSVVNEVARHYDLLIDEGNDPVLDSPELAAYMDGWDGAALLNALALDGTQDVLEIGVGTGRLALRVAPLSRSFTGIDISEKTIARAAEHLAGLAQVRLIRADFMAWETQARFHVIYSSLTFLHLADKPGAAQGVARLLAPGGRAVISLDKATDAILDYGTRRLTIHPDNPEAMAAHLRAAGLTILSVQETAQARIITAVKGEDS